MTARIVILGWGNPSRGDDALGPLFCERIESWLSEAGRAADCDIVQDFQLQVEHALDLVGRDLVLFVDATQKPRGDAPSAVEFSRIEARRDASHTTHALSPQAVLAVYQQIHGEAPPPAFLLGLHGESFELGDGLSAAAERGLDAACAFARTLLSRPEATAWAAYARAAVE